MWHEARRQERKIRGMLVDYRKRAERRRDFYEKIKADPTQFLQVHGRQCKIHLDPNVAAAADSAVMMPWQGQQDNLIDRFDVRAHLDYIPPVKKEEDSEMSQDERQLNYERYRIIAQNSFLGITEEKFLKQLHLEEQFGYTESKSKKEPKVGGAAIGFNYEDGTGVSNYPQEQEEESDDNSDSDLDVDLAINVSKMDPTQAHEMNKHGRNFGMSSNDFYSFLTNDMEEAESYKLAKEEEQEKALFSGRRSRRERRYHREKRLANRKLSPPSYAAQASPTLPQLRASKSPSRSPTPDNTGKITYITSFGDDEEPSSNAKLSLLDKFKSVKSKFSSRRETSTERTVYKKRSRSRSKDRLASSRRRGAVRRSRSSSKTGSSSRRRTLSRSRRSRSRTGRSRSQTKNKKSRSRSRSLSRSRSRSIRSGSKLKRTRSRSKSRSGSRSRKSRSRSRSRYIKSFRRKRTSSTSSSSSSKSSSTHSKDKEKSSSTPMDWQTSSTKSPVDDNKIPKPVVAEPESAPKVIPRYYGRKRSDDSSSELSEDDNEEDVDMKPAHNPESSDSKSGVGNSSGSTIKQSSATSSTMTIIERLKRKRQALLNRQFKADKIAEQLKTEREKQEQQTREDELREMAIRIRRRQREIRHAYDSRSSSSSDSEGSRRSSKDSDTKRRGSSERSKDGDETKKRERRDRKTSGDRRERSRERDRRDRDRRDRDTDRNRDVDRNREFERNRDRDRERDRDRNRNSRRDDDRRDRRSSNSPQRQVYVSRRREDNGDKADDGRSGRALVDY